MKQWRKRNALTANGQKISSAIHWAADVDPIGVSFQAIPGLGKDSFATTKESLR